MHEDPEIREMVRRLLAGSAQCETAAQLAAKLAKSREEGRPLTIKAGFDPTAADLHLGHTVVLNRMRTFQEMGHRVVFVVGDFTALIGDPTGRNEARKPLSPERIAENARTYTEQVFKILDPARTDIRFNSEWLKPLGAEGLIRLAARYTVSRMLERDDFKKRYAEQSPISVHEFLYPLLQAYDSVALQADVELGGSDQLFNLLVGRAIQRDHGQEPQVVLTMPLLEGTDAKVVNGTLVGAKMSKSLGNYIGVSEPPTEQFLKVMAISDDLMWRYYELLSRRDAAEVARMQTECRVHAMNPRDAKETLAFELVERFHGEAAAVEARDAANRWLRERSVQTLDEIVLPAPREGIALPNAVRAIGWADGTSEVRRRMTEGAVRVDGERIGDPRHLLMPGQTYEIHYGRKRAAKVTVVVGG